MFKNFSSMLRDDNEGTLVEYALVITFVSIASTGALQYLWAKMKANMNASNAQMQ